MLPRTGGGVGGGGAGGGGTILVRRNFGHNVTAVWSVGRSVILARVALDKWGGSWFGL